MMEGNDILKLIEDRWLKSERYELLAAFERAPRGAATGGEGVMLIGLFLSKLKTEDPEGYNDAEDLIVKYLDWYANH